MQIQATSPEHPLSSQPQIFYDETVCHLSFEAEAVLAMAFSDYDWVVVSQELGGGFTQSRVLVELIRSDDTDNLPLVVKIGPTWLIRQEQEAYTQYIHDKLAGRIELDRVELSEAWGVLGY